MMNKTLLRTHPLPLKSYVYCLLDPRTSVFGCAGVFFKLVEDKLKSFGKTFKKVFGCSDPLRSEGFKLTYHVSM
ncbi:MAG: hypothetical protein DDT31_00305 [Syntrophomonadaceae bacterium]|nr:hypothetical protein [Bacillota bacterium]